MKKSKKGFTLIELIVVLAILAVIAAIAVPTAFGSIEKARQSADTASIDSYNSAIRMQAALLAARPDDADNTLEKAIDEAGLDSTKKGQSSNGIGLVFHPADGKKCAYFEVTGAANALSNKTTFKAALEAAIKTADATNDTLAKQPCIAKAP